MAAAAGQGEAPFPPFFGGGGARPSRRLLGRGGWLLGRGITSRQPFEADCWAPWGECGLRRLVAAPRSLTGKAPRCLNVGRGKPARSGAALLLEPPSFWGEGACSREGLPPLQPVSVYSEVPPRYVEFYAPERPLSAQDSPAAFQRNPGLHLLRGKSLTPK